jgi:hypothetical protein
LRKKHKVKVPVVVTPPSTSPTALGLREKGRRGRPSKAETAAKIALLKASRRTNETFTQRVERISERFTVMYRLIQGVIQGVIRSLIISGAPGTGKSHTTRQLLESAGDAGLIKFKFISGKISAVDLFKWMQKYKEKKDVILLDDADSVYDDEDAMNILKAGLDTTHVRKISWLAESNALKSEGLALEFVYEGSMIFITNKDFQSIVDFEKNKMVPHFAALMSRSIYLDTQLHDSADLLAWTEHMVLNNHILVQDGLSEKQEKNAVEWMKKNADNLREISIRTLKKLGGFMLTAPEDTSWEAFARVTLLR